MATTAFQPGGYPGKPYGSFAGRVAGPTNYTLSCATGVYAYAGGTATLAVTRNYVLTCATGVYVYSGGTADLQVSTDGGLIGRKYPRRGRSRPRKILDIPEDKLPEVSEKIQKEKQQITEELAEAQADLVSVKQMEYSRVKHTKLISDISSTINKLEADLTRVREEEVLIMLSLMALEM